MNCSTPGFPVLHCLLEFAQTLVHWVCDAIQPSHPLSPASPPALNLSQHQNLFQWVGSSHQVAKVLELQCQHQSSNISISLSKLSFSWCTVPGILITRPLIRAQTNAVTSKPLLLSADGRPRTPAVLLQPLIWSLPHSSVSFSVMFYKRSPTILIFWDQCLSLRSEIAPWCCHHEVLYFLITVSFWNCITKFGNQEVWIFPICSFPRWFQLLWHLNHFKSSYPWTWYISLSI